MPGVMAPLTFGISNHDDLFAILDKIAGSKAVPAAEAAEFVIGLKLFLEVAIRHRKEALFEGIWPHIGDFMKRLKSLSAHDAAS